MVKDMKAITFEAPQSLNLKSTTHIAAASALMGAFILMLCGHYSLGCVAALVSFAALLPSISDCSEEGSNEILEGGEK